MINFRVILPDSLLTGRTRNVTWQQGHLLPGQDMNTSHLVQRLLPAAYLRSLPAKPPVLNFWQMFLQVNPFYAHNSKALISVFLFSPMRA